MAGDDGRDAVVAAVVEHPADIDIGLGVVLDRADELFARRSAADHHRAAVQPPGGAEMADAE